MVAYVKRDVRGALELRAYMVIYYDLYGADAVIQVATGASPFTADDWSGVDPSFGRLEDHEWEREW